MDEAQAIKGYSELLDLVANSEINSDDRQTIFDVVTEIIGDELNHMERLGKLYEKISGIQAKGD